MSLFKRKNKNIGFRRFIMYSLGFILSISVALPAYIQSSFLRQYISLEAVSVFFIASNLLIVCMIGLFPIMIRKIGNYFSTNAIIVLYAGAMIGLTLANDKAGAIASLLLYAITSNLLWINMDILLEGFSSDKKTGRIRTLFLTFNNLGWIISPMFSAYLIKLGGFSFAFAASAVLVIPLAIVVISQRKHLKSEKKYKREHLLKSFNKLWKNKNLKGVFIAAVALNIFFSCAVLYIPVYLNQTMGIGWKDLGWMFSLMLFPFVMFELPAGYLADKYFGEKEMMFIGLFTICISLILFFLIKISSPWIWAAALFLSRVGAALLESMRDTYFFKNIGAKEIGFINLFRMATPIGYLIGAAVASILLIFLPINYIFLAVTAIILPSFYYISLIKDTK